VVVEDEPLAAVVDMYFLIAANKACSRSLLAVAVLEPEDTDVEESEDDTPEPFCSPNPPGGGPGGGPWLAMADTNWLSVRLPLPLVSIRLHIWVA